MDASRTSPTIDVYATADGAFAAVAGELAGLLRQRARERRRLVLGLATGASARGVYVALRREHAQHALPVTDVESFNLDEYWPCDPASRWSFRAFMRRELFEPLGFDPGRIRIPDGRVAAAAVNAHCLEYEQRIRAAGGIDWQLLGIGRNAHIAFNEPGSAASSRTRLVDLAATTRRAARVASSRTGAETADEPPECAISMGIATILAARRIVLLAVGTAKSAAVRAALEDAPSPSVPASWLQRHANVRVVLDSDAAAELGTSGAAS